MDSIYLNMAKTKWGRITLHAMACCSDHHFQFHFQGVLRELGHGKNRKASPDAQHAD